MLTVLLLGRSPSHQLQRLPVGSSTRDQTLRHTPSPVLASGCICGGRPPTPEDSNSPSLPAPPPVAPTLLPVPAQSQVQGSPGPKGQSSWQGAGSQADCSGKAFCTHLRSLHGIRPW